MSYLHYTSDFSALAKSIEIQADPTIRRLTPSFPYEVTLALWIGFTTFVFRGSMRGIPFA